MRIAGHILIILIPAVMLLTVWQTIIVMDPSRAFFIGSPSGVWHEFMGLMKGGVLLRHAFITSIEALLGFIGGTILGTTIGLVLTLSNSVYQIARPYLVALGAVPVFALGPMLIFWFGTGIWSKVALAFLSTLVIAIVQAYSGANEADNNLLRLTRAFGGNRTQEYVKIIIPSAVIWVLAGVRLNIGMALLGAFIGEFISSQAGLGHLIIVAEGLFNVNQIWVGVFSIVVVAIVAHAVTLPVERRASRWKLRINQGGA